MLRLRSFRAKTVGKWLRLTVIETRNHSLQSALNKSRQSSDPSKGWRETEASVFPRNLLRTQNVIIVPVAGGIKMKGQDARYIPPRRERDGTRRRWRDRCVRWFALAAVILGVALIALTLIYWRAEAEYSDQQRACITQRYGQFDARKLTQCVDVCKACMKGNTVTCNTSCKLKGAS